MDDWDTAPETESGDKETPRTTLLEVNEPLPADLSESSDREQRLSKLKHAVHQFVAPYTSRAVKPPFRDDEVILMAAICCPYQRFTRRAVFASLIQIFSYYGQKALKLYMDGFGYREGHTAYSIMEGFETAFRTYGLPLEKVEDSDIGRHNIMQQLWTVNTAAAWQWLSDHLSPRVPDGFNFLGLPAELRLQVYEYVLTYSAFYMESSTDRRGLVPLVAMSGAHEEDALPLLADPHEAYHTTCPHFHKLPLIQDMLAILTVNKQVYREAVPIFYGVNHFYLRHPSGLNSLTRALAPSRLKHVARITFDYEHDTVKETKKFGRTLLDLSRSEGLKHVVLRASDSAWFVDVKNLRSRVPKYQQPGQLPSIDQLCELLSTVSSLQIVGHCPRIEAYIRAKMSEIGEKNAQPK